MTTILFVPPADRPDVFTPSVGGGTVPMWGRFPGGPWENLDACLDIPKFPIKALVLAVKGEPDSLGMDRARNVLAQHAGPCTGGGTLWLTDAGKWKLWSWRFPMTGDGVTHEYPMPESPANVGNGFAAWALATTLAARIGGTVVLA